MNNRVYAGLSAGDLVIFKRNKDGKWLTNDYETIKISEKPIVKLAASQNNRLWIAFGNEIAVYEAINELKFIVRSKFTLELF